MRILPKIRVRFKYFLTYHGYWSTRIYWIHSVSSILLFSFNHLVAAYVFFLLLPSLLHKLQYFFNNMFKKPVLTYEETNPYSLPSLHFNYDIRILSRICYISSLSHATRPLYNYHLTRHRLSIIYSCRVSDSNIYVLNWFKW